MPAIRRPRSKTQKAPELQFRVRIMHKGEIAFGPGKAELLTAIQKHGSIAKGAKSLGMSYMRAWTLVKVMNKSFRKPLIEMERGGTEGGATRLTPLGLDVLRLYSELVAQSRTSVQPIWDELQGLLNR
jgi:molybdate transport system regulatory protein